MKLSVHYSFIIKIFAVFLSVCLFLVPVFKASKVNATVAIPSIVSSLFLAVALSLGIYFDLAGIDINAWAEARIQAYLSSQGYSSVSDWLGAQFDAEITVSGSFLGLTPDLFAKVKAAVEFSIGNGSIPTGGSEASPVYQDIIPKYYISDLTLTNLITNTTNSYTNLPLIYLNDLVSGSGNLLSGDHPLNYLPTNYLYTIQYSTVVGNSNNSSFTNIINFVSNTITGDVSIRSDNSYYSIRTHSGSDYAEQVSYITIPSSSPYPINTQYPIYAIPIAYTLYNNTQFTIIHVYRSTNGTYYLRSFNSLPWSNIPVVISDQNGRIISIGQPEYNFNQVDTVYIDLQIGELTSSLQALTALLTAINNNLVTWTIAIQSNSPGDLPVDTTNLIDLVDYCNEQTNLYMSGTQSMAQTLGNMYTELYNTLGTTQSAQLSNAIINAYNAFINKLTLFEQSTSSVGSSYASVQQFTSELRTIQTNAISTGSITSALTTALNSLNTYVGSATSIEEIIGLHNAYQSFLDGLGVRLESATNSKAAVTEMNTIVDNFLAGTITREQALNQLLAKYKSELRSNAKTAEDVSAIISGYQTALDRITMEAVQVDPEGLGTTAPEVIEMEDDLLDQLEINQLSTFLAFQNWQYINTNEGNLYREFFQRILSSDSPFYLFIYVPMVLGIVGIILGTRIHFGGKNVSKEIDNESTYSTFGSWDHHGEWWK